ncbi:hypothetical protein B0H15DRAFT_807546 [Mycena belliarum]|uniref:Uncharacterized protein n=1 Tax=Mycena belliarum TaxID=1033014 RepID=A0AAD6XHQ3_9AGAR|nr:hypothetical protein B0H15DRAFT_807546 [Mycena belliae]
MAPRLEKSWVPYLHLNCVPSYFPHPDHTHTIVAHSANPDCLFFGIIDGDYAGVLTDFSQVQDILRKVPTTEYFTDQSWIGITKKWRAACDAKHEHGWPSGSSSPTDADAFDVSPRVSSRTSPPSSPSPKPRASRMKAKQPLRSPPPSPLATRLALQRSRTELSTPTPTLLFSEKGRSGGASRASSISTSFSFPSDVSFISSSIVSAVPSSPNKGNPALRFPTPDFSSPPSLLPFPANLLPEMGLFPRDPLPPRLQPQQPSGLSASRPGSRASVQPVRPPSAAHSSASPARATQDVPLREGSDATVMYAVTGCNRLLRSRKTAFQLLQATRGAEMHLAVSVGEAAGYFDSVQGPPMAATMYAVAGHRTVHRDREKSFRVFLKEKDGHMFFSDDASLIDEFIREHTCI